MVKQLSVPFRRSPIALTDKYGARPWLIFTIAAIVLVGLIAGIVLAVGGSGGSPTERPVMVPVVVQG